MLLQIDYLVFIMLICLIILYSIYMLVYATQKELELTSLIEKFYYFLGVRKVINSCKI